MRKFLITLVGILAVWFAIDRIGGEMMWYVNQHTNDMTSPKVKKIVNGIDADVVLMGTSRCNGHYVPQIIADTLGARVYNAGIDGSDNIYAQYLALCHIVAHKCPKVICLEVQNCFIEEENNAYATTSFFAPYFGQNERADSVFRDAGTYWLYQLSHLYRFNAKALSNITGLLKDRWAEEDNGYIPITQPDWYPESLRLWDEVDPTSPDKLKYIIRFIGLCREYHIQLVWMVSPTYSIVGDHYYDALKTVARQNDIPFLDYHTPSLYHNHPEYFRDETHLWDKGARLYSAIFAGDLKRLLQIQN